MKRILILDTENTNIPKNISYKDYNKVIFLLPENKTMLESYNNLNIENKMSYIVHRTGKNNMDFHIVYVISGLLTKFDSIKIEILSSDTGFDDVFRQMNEDFPTSQVFRKEKASMLDRSKSFKKTEVKIKEIKGEFHNEKIEINKIVLNKGEVLGNRLKSLQGFYGKSKILNKFVLDAIFDIAKTRENKINFINSLIKIKFYLSFANFFKILKGSGIKFKTLESSLSKSFRSNEFRDKFLSEYKKTC